jgi:hypothetical protein
VRDSAGTHLNRSVRRAVLAAARTCPSRFRWSYCDLSMSETLVCALVTQAAEVTLKKSQYNLDSGWMENHTWRLLFVV